MQKLGLNGIYESYICDGMIRDTTESNKLFNEIINAVGGVFSANFQDKMFDLINLYTAAVEERSFKDGFKYATQLWKECDR